MGCGASAQAEAEPLMLSTKRVTEVCTTTSSCSPPPPTPTPALDNTHTHTQPIIRRKWVCRKCTLRNKEGTVTCGACGCPVAEGGWRSNAPFGSSFTPPASLPAVGAAASAATRGNPASPNNAHLFSPSSSVNSASSTSSHSTSYSMPATCSRRAHKCAENSDVQPVQFFWCRGEPAETCVDGVWVPCTVLSAAKGQVEVELEGEVANVREGDVRRCRLAECCICLDPLCQKTLGAFVDEVGARVCRHYVHRSCGTALPVRTCPVCRAEFEHIVQVPRADRDAREWFHVVGYTNTGRLSPQEVNTALSAVVPYSEEEVSAMVKEKWATWDTEMRGYITVGQVDPLVRHFFV